MYCTDYIDVPDPEIDSLSSCAEKALAKTGCEGGGGYFLFANNGSWCGCCTDSNAKDNVSGEQGTNLYKTSGSYNAEVT